MTNRTEVVDDGTYEYSSANQLLKITWPDDIGVVFEYHPNGKVYKEIWNNGGSREFNDKGQLIKIIFNDGDWCETEYHGNGVRSKETWNDGTVKEYEADDIDEIVNAFFK